MERGTDTGSQTLIDATVGMAASSRLAYLVSYFANPGGDWQGALTKYPARARLPDRYFTRLVVGVAGSRGHVLTVATEYHHRDVGGMTLQDMDRLAARRLPDPH